MITQIVAASPIAFFLLAGMLEIRRDAGSVRSLSRAIPVLLGIGVAVLLLVPLHLYIPSTSGSFFLSRTMTAVSLVILGCGFVCRFRSRPAATFVVAGGGGLVSFFVFNCFFVLGGLFSTK